MSVDLEKGATVELVKTLSDDIRTASDGSKYGSAGDAVRAKANKVGNYPNIKVGTIEQLISDNYTEESKPYLFRKSESIGDRAEDLIVGGTIAWNQLFSPSLFVDSYTKHGLTFTKVTDKLTYSVSGTVSAVSDRNCYIKRGDINLPLLSSHKYCCLCDSKYLNPYFFGVTVTGNIIDRVGGCVISASESGNANVSMFLLSSVSDGTVINETFNLGFFDLTQMFGSTVADAIYAKEQASAGAGVAFFRSMFPQPYYAYNAGELKHVGGLVSHDTVGFNIWDEEWEFGSLDANGMPTVATQRIRSKNFIPVLPSTSYYGAFVGVYTSGTWYAICYYDANKNFISNSSPNKNAVFTTPSNAHYIKFNTSDAWGTMQYNGGICINLSSSRNGQYEPYHKHSYALDSSLTLRGIPKLDSENRMYFDGDEYASDGSVKRKYGVVDLGSLTWTYNSTRKYFSSDTIDNIRVPTNTGVKTDWVICPLYTILTPTKIYSDAENNNNTIAVFGGAYFGISNLSYTDAETFKTAMNGVYLVYELATPTTETAEPYQNPQIVSPYGSEEYVCETDADVLCPVGHRTKYFDDLRGKLEGLPSNFSTLIAPTETAMVATRNYTVGDLLIVNNVLYKVTANIANGATITVNTNVSQTTLSALLKALSA